MSADLLHPLVEALPSIRRWRQAEAEATERAEGIRARVRAADAKHQTARAAWQRDFDAGRASPPPQWHPPGDLAALEQEMRRVRDQRRDALAEAGDEADVALRRRSAELLAQAGVLVDELETIAAEAQELCSTARAVLAARGTAGANTSIPSRVTIADLADAVAAGELLPADPVARPVLHDPERPGVDESAYMRREAEERAAARERHAELAQRQPRPAGRPASR